MHWATHAQIPSDAHMHMLATDYPWNYLLEDIPVSQPFTTTEELSKDKRLEKCVVFVYKEAARRRSASPLASPAPPLFQYEDSSTYKPDC